MTKELPCLQCPECGGNLEFHPKDKQFIICGNPNGCDRYVVWKYAGDIEGD